MFLLLYLLYPDNQDRLQGGVHHSWRYKATDAKCLPGGCLVGKKMERDKERAAEEGEGGSTLHHRVKNLQSVEDLIHPAAPLHHSRRCHHPPSAHTTHGDGGREGGGARLLGCSAALVFHLSAKKPLVARLVPSAHSPLTRLCLSPVLWAVYMLDG